MKPNLDEALIKDFPLTFNRSDNGREPWSMFGFEVGDGWEPAIRRAAEKLEPLFKAAIEKDQEGYGFGYYRTTQLKEKYGTGRWYLSGGSEDMYKIVEDWEEETAKICEQCGKPGELQGSGWYYTACYDCTRVEDRNKIFGSLEVGKKKEKDNG